MKLNVLLAKTDALGASFKNMVSDYGKFFNKNQGAFKGAKGTYSPKEGTIDDPSKRGNTVVQTTVEEKLQWFIENSTDYIDALFSQEKTNSLGVATAELIVEEESWGIFTSLELLRLKSIIENNGLVSMISHIPVRSDSEEWALSQNEMYSGREVYENPIIRGTAKTTEKESYILTDPNVDHNSPNYTPTVAQKTTTVELGDYTVQKFSGEWSQRQKAEALKRRNTLYVAVIEALKVCNEVEVMESDMTSKKIFGYIFNM